MEPQSHFISEDLTGVPLFTAFLSYLCYKTKQTQLRFGKKNISELYKHTFLKRK